MEQIKEKWDSILILVVLLGTLLGIINPRFDAIESRFNSLEAKVDANTVAITELNGKIDALELKFDNKIDALELKFDNKIDAVESKFDNKFNNLANMMIVAHTNGDVTEAELVSIWERVIEP